MAASARSAWAGAIEFGGFLIHMRAYTLVQSRSAQSFKSLCPCHQQPVVMPKRCAVDGGELDSGDLLKGHPTGKDKFVVVPPEAAEQIRSAEASDTLAIRQISPLASLPMHLITGHFRLTPDEKVAGSDGPVQVLWNGLSASSRGLVTEWVPRAGARDSLLVIHADEFGLTGNTIPYKSELKDAPEFKPVPDPKAAQMFEQFAAMQGIDMDDFRHGFYESSYEQRRAQAIEAALSGKPVDVSAPASAPAAGPDLMALMTAALDAAAPAKPKAKGRAKAKAKVPA